MTCRRCNFLGEKRAGGASGREAGLNFLFLLFLVLEEAFHCAYHLGALALQFLGKGVHFACNLGGSRFGFFSQPLGGSHDFMGFCLFQIACLVGGKSLDLSSVHFFPVDGLVPLHIIAVGGVDGFSLDRHVVRLGVLHINYKVLELVEKQLGIVVMGKHSRAAREGEQK